MQWKWPRLRVCVLALCAAVLVVYLPGLAGGFLFDDYPNLLRDNDWRIEQLGWAELWQAMSQGISSPAGRPLALLSFGLTYLAFGIEQALPYKLGNVLLHIGNGLLIFFLLQRLLPRLQVSPRWAGWLALWLAGLWLLHPLQVSTVLYVVQRMEIGAASGILLALLGYVRLRERQLQGHGPGWQGPLLAVAGMAFGLGFKETALLTPGFAFLLELTVFGFRRADGSLSRGWMMVYGAGLILAVLAYLRLVAPFFVPGSLYDTRDFGPWERLLSQPRMLMMYLGQIVLPRPEAYTFYYDQVQASRGLFEPASTAWSLAGLLALIGTAAASWRRWPLLALGVGWFLMAHALTSNLVPLELAFEHRNYLALLGPPLAVLPALAWCVRRLNTDARIMLALVLLLGLTTLSWTQTATWGNPLRLAWTLENRAPQSARASYELGRLLLLEAGDDDRLPGWSLALKTFERTQQLPTASPLASQGVIQMRARAGREITPDTWQRFRELLVQRPLTPEGLSALFAVNKCRINKQCAFDDSQLLATHLAVLERNPDNAALRTLYADFAWNVLDDKVLAIAVQREAVALAGDSMQSRVTLLGFLSASALQTEQEEARGLLAELLASGAGRTHGSALDAAGRRLGGG